MEDNPNNKMSTLRKAMKKRELKKKTKKNLSITSDQAKVIRNSFLNEPPRRLYEKRMPKDKAQSRTN